jgi:serine/threonine protein kinase
VAALSDSAVERLRQAAEWPDLGGRYEALEVVARGGMGTVYRARDHLLEREVAIKVLAGAGADELAARMLGEAKILARLEHPGIVPVHDVGRLEDGRVYYAMRLVAGSRLDEHPARHAPLAERLRIFGRICEAVAFANAHGVVHRDLKPANVMVGPFGEVLVMDWGVAKVLAEADGSGAGGAGERASRPGDGPPAPPVAAPPATTAHGTVLGTPGYMAPEQARGESGLVDQRADVYALGAVLRFLLAGADGPPEERRPAIPRPLAAICRKALAADPQARYPDVPALAADVSNYQAGLAVGAYRESLGERAWRFVRRHRTAALLLLAYLVMRVVLLLVARV